MGISKDANIPEKLHGLDHLRALAISLVFLYHYQLFGHPLWLEDIAKFGWTGVDLFFVLSGFLISSQLFDQIKQKGTISFKAFFFKRFFRIIPAYWAVVAIYFVFPFFREKEALPPIWKFLTFTQNFGLNLKDHGTFSQAWSLCVEEHFYLLLPITLIILLTANFFNKGYWLLIGLFIAGFAIRVYSWNCYEPYIHKDNSWVYWYQYLYYPTYCRLDGLLFGVAIAALYQFMPDIWARVSNYGNQMIVASLLVLAGAYFLCCEEHSYYAAIFGFPLIAFGYGLIVIGAISPTSFLYKWNSNIATFLATISYSVYLTHKGVIHMIQSFIFTKPSIDIDGTLVLFICILGCLIVGSFMTMAIEKPFLRLRSYFIK